MNILEEYSDFKKTSKYKVRWKASKRLYTIFATYWPNFRSVFCSTSLTKIVVNYRSYRNCYALSPGEVSCLNNVLATGFGLCSVAYSGFEKMPNLFADE